MRERLENRKHIEAIMDPLQQEWAMFWIRWSDCLLRRAGSQCGGSNRPTSWYAGRGEFSSMRTLRESNISPGKVTKVKSIPMDTALRIIRSSSLIISRYSLLQSGSCGDNILINWKREGIFYGVARN